MIFEPSKTCFHMIYIPIWSYAWKKFTICTFKNSTPCSLTFRENTCLKHRSSLHLQWIVWWGTAAVKLKSMAALQNLHNVILFWFLTCWEICRYTNMILLWNFGHSPVIHCDIVKENIIMCVSSFSSEKIRYGRSTLIFIYFYYFICIWGFEPYFPQFQYIWLHFAHTAQ